MSPSDAPLACTLPQVLGQTYELIADRCQEEATSVAPIGSSRRDEANHVILHRAEFLHARGAGCGWLRVNYVRLSGQDRLPQPQ